MIDVLGTRGNTESLEWNLRALAKAKSGAAGLDWLELVYGFLGTIFAGLAAIPGINIPQPIPIALPDETKVQGFSDTILVAVSGSRPPEEYLPIVGMRMTNVFSTALKEGVYLRGAIGMGDWVEFNDFLAGPAVLEVAACFEAADWIGVHLTPRAEYGLEVLTEGKRDPQWFVKYRVPMKPDEADPDASEVERWVLDWPSSKAIDRAALVRVFASNTLPPEAQRKFRATLEFLETRAANPDEKKSSQA